MSGHQKKSPGFKKLEELITKPEFTKDLEEARLLDEFSIITEVFRLINYYGLPTSIYPTFKRLVYEGDLIEVKNTGHVTVENKNGQVVLKLPFDITKGELQAFIESEWSKQIKPKLKAQFGKRRSVRSSYFPAKKKDIFNAYVARKQNKKTVKDLEVQFGVNRSTIYRIVEEYKMSR